MKRSEKELRQDLALFCNLVDLILGGNRVNGFIVTKIVQKIKFEETWCKLETKNVF